MTSLKNHFLIITTLIFTLFCSAQEQCEYYVDLPFIGVKKITITDNPTQLDVNFIGYPAELEMEECRGNITIQVYKDVKGRADKNKKTLIAKGQFILSKELDSVEVVKMDFETNKEERTLYMAYSGWLNGSWDFITFRPDGSTFSD